MKIAVLDGYAMNPGDLDWGALEKIGACAIYERTRREDVLARAEGVEAILTNKVMFDKATIQALPALRYIGVTATGYNIVDTDAAKARNITVTNVPAYSTASVAQAVFALLLEMTNRTGAYDAAVHKGKWQASADFCFYEGPSALALEDLTMGVVGFGEIGQQVARIAAAFGMKIIAATRTKKSAPAGLNVEFCEMDRLFAHADVISLHCPLTPDTKNLVNEERLSRMKPKSMLINTSRGGVVDEQALADALNSGRIAGAGLDVLSTEPPRADNPLLTARNCVITPHVAWASAAARRKLYEVVLFNLRRFIAGQPVNVVNA